jgi:nicotinamide-nucleotide amidase
VVTYSNEAKQNILGIPSEILKKYGAVSPECALEMASHIRRISRTDYGIAVTGIAGPSGGTESKPVGTVHVALASKKGTREKKYFIPTNREWFKLMVSSIALDTLRKELI